METTNIITITLGITIPIILISVGFGFNKITAKTKQMEIKNFNQLQEIKNMSNTTENTNEWKFINGGHDWSASAQISPCGKFILVKERKQVAGHNAAGSFPTTNEFHLISTENFRKTKLEG